MNNKKYSEINNKSFNDMMDRAVEEIIKSREDSQPNTITLKRIYSTHCQVCGEPFSLSNIHLAMPTYRIVYFVPLDNNITCLRCARESGLEFEPRIYKEGE